tara:strand:- start:33 stop:857 length:825 start_codon:yes stop_codon:yes gene_type:complete
VTKEDYEARILNLPEKFGNIAKVFVDRRDSGEVFGDIDIDTSDVIDTAEFQEFWTTGNIPTIDVYVLTYDSNKILKELPSSPTDDQIHPLMANIKEYISNYRMITDQITLLDGYIINFGVAFEVVAHRSSNRSDVKLRCINKIIQYFNIDKMQFHQTLYTSDLIYQLMDVEGVRAVNYIELTQDFNDLSGTRTLNLTANDNILIYDKEYDHASGDWSTSVGSQHSGQYGWKYPFHYFYESDSSAYIGEGIILPAVTPSVFELKNPNTNIRGVVK